MGSNSIPRDTFELLVWRVKGSCLWMFAKKCYSTFKIIKKSKKKWCKIKNAILSKARLECREGWESKYLEIGMTSFMDDSSIKMLKLGYTFLLKIQWIWWKKKIPSAFFKKALFSTVSALFEPHSQIEPHPLKILIHPQ